MNKRVVAFAASMATFAGLAWLCGYDFDQRSPGVAIGALFAICVSAWVAACPLIDD